MDDVRQLVELAEQTASALRKVGVEPLLIGALALAAHGYQRGTNDIDLGVSVSPAHFKTLCTNLRKEGLYVYLSESDGNDPLGGVIALSLEPFPEFEDDEDQAEEADFDWNLDAAGPPKVEIINFDNSPSGGFPAIIPDALARSQMTSELVKAAVPTLEDLIILKAYAGGFKSRNDVAELLTRSSPDLVLLRKRAESYALSQSLEYVLGGLI